MNKDITQEKIYVDTLKDLQDLITKATNDAIIRGGLFVVQTLKDGMKITGLDYVPKMWLDTTERELLKHKEKKDG